MEYITPYNRSQIEFSSLDDLVEQDNQVRFIEAFVEKLDLIQLSFVTKDIKSEGRPSFNPKALLTLYFYGCSAFLVFNFGKVCKVFDVLCEVLSRTFNISIGV